MMWGQYPMMAGGWGIGAAIVNIIFWSVVALVIIFIIRMLVRGSHVHGMHDGMHHWGMEDSAIRILKERYARGEIDKTEYESKMKDLMMK